MTSRLVVLLTSAAMVVLMGGCSSKTTNGGPYLFQGASDVASVAHMTGCVAQPGGHGVDPNGYVMCDQGDVNWSGAAPDDPSTIGMSQDGLDINGAGFEIQCNARGWCEKALAALIAWVSPVKTK